MVREEKQEGHPFKCGAAALIHWLKTGKRSDRGLIAESFFIHQPASSPRRKHQVITEETPASLNGFDQNKAFQPLPDLSMTFFRLQLSFSRDMLTI